MTSSNENARPDPVTRAGRALGSAGRGLARNPLAMLAVVASWLVSLVTTVVVLQEVLWPVVHRDVARWLPEAASQAPAASTTPAAVVVSQASVGAVVGVALVAPLAVALATGWLRDRDRWPDEGVPTAVALLATLGGYAGFLAGLTAGYLLGGPALVDAFGGGTVLIRLVQAVLALSVASGLAVQAAVAAGVLASRRVALVANWPRDSVLPLGVAVVAGLVLWPRQPAVQAVWAVPVCAGLILATVLLAARVTPTAPSA